MHHEVHGEALSGHGTVLLSSGLGGGGSFWAPQLEALCRQHRVVTYDQRGTGRSAEPLPDPYSVSTMADDVTAILDGLGIGQCHFVGHALGGLVGLDLALRRPDRVASLALAGAWARGDAHTARCFDVRRDLLRIGPEAYVRAQPLFLYPAPWMARNAERLAREHEHALAHFQGTDTLLKRIAALLAFDVADRLEEIACPTLVAAARDDLLVPWTASETLAAGIPGARLWVTAEGGHGFTVTEPEAFNAALCGFLAEQRA